MPKQLISGNAFNNGWGTQPTTGGFQSQGYDWSGAGSTQPNTGWPSVNPINPMVSGVPVGETGGVTVEPVIVNANNLDTEAIINMMNYAISLYKTNQHDRRSVANEVAKLRQKMSAKQFDPFNSMELRNIFGYMFGDIISELTATRGNDYDSILKVIFDNFPETNTFPIESEYVKNGSKYGGVGPYAKVISDVKRFIAKNQLKTPTTVSKFLKIWEDFKTKRPELDKIDVQDLFNNFNR